MRSIDFKDYCNNTSFLTDLFDNFVEILCTIKYLGKPSYFSTISEIIR